MTQQQESIPVPCANCGKDINLDYPNFAMAAIAGICGECEQQAIAWLNTKLNANK